MSRAVAIQASAERLDRTAKFAGEVFGMIDEDEHRYAPRGAFISPRLLGIGVALIACGAAFLM